MRKYSLLISGILLVLLGIGCGLLWFMTHNVFLGLLAGTTILGCFILYKARQIGGRLLPARVEKLDSNGKIKEEPNTFTFYAEYDPVTQKERGDRLEVEYVAAPVGRPQPVTNLGNKKFYFRRNVPSHNGDSSDEKFEPVTLPDCKYMPPGLFVYPLTMPSYTKYMKYIKPEGNTVSVWILALIIGVEIIGMIIIT